VIFHYSARAPNPSPTPKGTAYLIWNLTAFPYQGMYWLTGTISNIGNGTAYNVTIVINGFERFNPIPNIPANTTIQHNGIFIPSRRLHSMTTWVYTVEYDNGE
jgi:hypothetical protein